ncbi:MAG: leucine efflux protein LeuE [Neisseriaceae bacterium]|nr:leucine efflux protein LeuE [Neisseriaceae bacterium]
MLAEFGVVNLWTYLVGVIFIIILPGPNSIYVLKTGVSHGVKAGYTAALGVFIGDAILIFCAYIGIASLIRTSPLFFTLIKFLGALYLLFLGLKILYASLFKPQQAAAPVIESGHSIMRKSLTLSLTNPKAILFYVSFFVQFIDFNYAHTSVSFLILAAILEIVSFVYLTTLIFAGALLAKFFSHRKILAKLGNSAVGVLFLAFATRLATLSN